MTPAEFISRLGHKARPVQKNGAWMACCPAHEDKTPSLSVSSGARGLLLRCFANCSTDAVCQAAGIKVSELFYDAGKPARNGVSRREHHGHPAQVNSLSIVNVPKTKSRVVAEYDYRDHHGELRFQAIRFEPKDFRQRQPDGNGGWIWNLKNVEMLPYRLPELIASTNGAVHVVEGEKDADRLAAEGFVATCSPMGAGKWSDRFNHWFEGRAVVIVADKDEPGRKHAQDAAGQLHGVASSVRVVELSGDGVKDASDWFDAGGDAATFDEICQAAPAWELLPEGDVSSDDLFSNDVFYADAFVRNHKQRIRYCSDEKSWLIYDAKSGWLRDAANGVRKQIADYARGLYVDALEAAKTMEPDSGKRHIASRIALGNKKRIEPALSFAEADPQVTVKAEDLDANEFLLGVENGAIDLRNGSFTGHNEGQLVTRRCGTHYDAKATAPTWERFLIEVQPDPEVRGFLQRLAGYWFTGSTRDHVLPFFYGTGANGKGTYLEQGILKLAGTYGAKLTDAFVYLSGRGTLPQLEIANLCGTRFTLGEENAENKNINEQLLKSITGGDKVKGRFHYANFTEYFPSYKVTLVGNHKPKITGSDDGIWRRFVLVDWPVQIAPEKRDSLLGSKLAGEMPGILNWVIRGAIEWQGRGLIIPESCNVATQEFRQQSDELSDFVSERFVTERGSYCSKSDVFKEYLDWADKEGIHKPETKRGLGTQLINRGWHDAIIGNANTRVWMNQALISKMT